MEMLFDDDADSPLIKLAREYDNKKSSAAKAAVNGVRLTVVAYIRVSTDSDSQAHSPEMQRDVIMRYCKNRGYPPPKFFSDLGVSGKNKDRAGWEEMMLFVRANPGCIVVVYDMSRFARKLETFVILYKQVVSAKARLESVHNNTTNSLILGMLAIMAELELRSISIRLRDGRHRVAKAGKKLSKNPPWGYVYTPDGTDIQIDKKLREHIRHLYRMRAEGAPYSSLAEYLNDLGLPTPGGRKVWSPTNLPRILKSWIYVGVVKNKKVRFDFEYETDA